MQNTIQKFRQSSVDFEKQGILPENVKTLTSSNNPTVLYFLLKLRTRFLLTNVYKTLCGIFFYFIKILSFLQKNLRRPGFCTLHSFFTLLLTTQDLNKIKTIPHNLS